MEESTQVRDLWLRFCDRLTAGDVDGFDDLVATDAALIIGTAPGEWVDDRPRMRFGFEAEGVGLSPDAPVVFAEASMGWAADNPVFSFPDGSLGLGGVLGARDGRASVRHCREDIGERHGR